jgi:putative selenate reductase
MSDVMRPIGFDHLMTWILDEYATQKTIFGEQRLVQCNKNRTFPIFKEKIETPFGPAAGPNSQLAQNIIASYVTGARFFELKTVQIMDGEELSACVNKPCILASDEGYNCEWSTELTVPQAECEYIKAWVACKVLAKELDLGDPDGFVFNMSVGYSYDGIKDTKVDSYINHMMDASETETFKSAIAWLKANVDRFQNVDIEFIDSISPKVSDSITESTLHGCPPDEIERIATHLITVKGLNTYIKCNPTLLGYEFARKTLDSLGFGYIAFDDHHFVEDLQWEDAIPMMERLIKLTSERGLEFGVKLTNTFPVDVKAGELPSEEMYMSGRSLYPLSLALAARLSKQFDGKLRMSYSGGADATNIHNLITAGIWPITMATTVLKVGGYERFSQITGILADLEGKKFEGADVEAIAKLQQQSLVDPHYKKPIKPLPNRHVNKKLPLLDCFIAPCKTTCPINQDIPGYLRAVDEGRYEDALKIILERNALPFITGTICPHTCTNSCMRNYVDEHVFIREAKLKAAKNGLSKVLPTLTNVPATSDRKVAVIGGGPAGLAVASFLTRAGVDTTILERTEKLGGIVRHVIPEFRITGEDIDNDVELCLAYGAKVKTGVEVTSLEAVKAEGYTDVVVAIGAWNPGRAVLESGDELDALEFLEAAKKHPETLNLGTDVVVVGGGNTAMDVARAAKRIAGVKNVRLVYRRDKRNMPADEEELDFAVNDGVEFMELLAPKTLANGKLTCEVMKLGEPDASGRRSPEATGEMVEVPATAVICAVGERVDTSLYAGAGCELTPKGTPVVDKNLETSVKGIFAVGDARRGPATVVEGIADAKAVAMAISGYDFDAKTASNIDPEYGHALAKRGTVCSSCTSCGESRCLECPTVCEACTEVCPNRANIAIRVPGDRMRQIIHVDGMCNECGNCAIFCPYEGGRPYKDKFTLFWSKEDFDNSENQGFLSVEDGYLVRFDGTEKVYDISDPKCGLPFGLVKLIKAVETDYAYLMCK